MAEEPVKRPPPSLPEASLTAGLECLQLLDAHKFGVQGAAWIYSSSLGEWRYYLVTQLVEIDGPFETYQRIERLFGLKFNNQHLMIDDVHLGSPNEAIFRNFLSRTKLDGARLRNVTIEVIEPIPGGGVRKQTLLVEEAYIYRLHKTPPKKEIIKKRKAFDKLLEKLEHAAT